MFLRVLFVTVCLSAAFLLSSCDRISTDPGVTWSDCSKKGDRAKILNVTLSSSDSGNIEAANVTYFLDEEVSSGTIALNVTWGVVPYFSTSLDLCKTLQLKCPIKAGQGSLIFKENIPQFKHGLFTLHAVATDQDGKELACLVVKIHINM